MAEYEEEFSTKLSLQKFITVCEKLTEPQKQLLRDIGFGYLLDLCYHELPRCLVRWLVRYFDCPSRCFILPSGYRFFINSYTMHRILGIPLGGRLSLENAQKLSDVRLSPRLSVLHTLQTSES